MAQYSDIVEPAGSLRLLAGMRAFTLFVSLTPNNILERVMRTVNPSLVIKTSSYSPRDASESLDDLLSRQSECGIFQMLGSCTQVGSGFAILEDDTLEHLYRLQSDGTRHITTILSALRRQDKLLFNCNFSDWLGRAMLRLLNKDRFYMTDKATLEFICPQADDAGLHAFLTQYSLNPIGFDGQTDALIQKLAQISEAMQPHSLAISTSKPNGRGPTIFVSYTSENADFVRMIADRLLSLGFSDVWLDRKKLIGGDDWFDRIDEAIEKCDFFMPILSREADAQREKVFWGEWADALKRARRVKDVFLIPVGIDSDFPAKASYQRIADGETAVFFDKTSYSCATGHPQSKGLRCLARTMLPFSGGIAWLIRLHLRVLTPNIPGPGSKRFPSMPHRFSTDAMKTAKRCYAAYLLHRLPYCSVNPASVNPHCCRQACFRVCVRSGCCRSTCGSAMTCMRQVYPNKSRGNFMHN
ncbi:TIR domain-containing protein [Nitrosomonas aestuarii]|nr:toll/interleukin-1 receptor domain-containing protein [Nitrosomonas aestuarii]PTN12957.1 TIR domain-containing protein [Nitrosomonas aestuarii]